MPATAAVPYLITLTSDSGRLVDAWAETTWRGVGPGALLHDDEPGRCSLVAPGDLPFVPIGATVLDARADIWDE